MGGLGLRPQLLTAGPGGLPTASFLALTLTLLKAPTVFQALFRGATLALRPGNPPEENQKQRQSPEDYVLGGSQNSSNPELRSISIVVY